MAAVSGVWKCSTWHQDPERGQRSCSSPWRTAPTPELPLKYPRVWGRSSAPGRGPAPLCDLIKEWELSFSLLQNWTQSPRTLGEKTRWGLPQEDDKVLWPWWDGHWAFQPHLSTTGFPGGPSGKEPTSQCRRQKRDLSLCREDPLKEGVVTHSSILAWEMQEAPGSPQLQWEDGGSFKFPWGWLTVLCVEGHNGGGLRPNSEWPQVASACKVVKLGLGFPDKEEVDKEIGNNTGHTIFKLGN